MDGNSPEEVAEPEPLGLIPVGEVVRAERLAQQQAAAALDGKAGNVLGFAGALVALAAVRGSWPVTAATLAAALSAWFALVALRIDSHRVILPARARQAWLYADDTKARLEILDTEVNCLSESKLPVDPTESPPTVPPPPEPPPPPPRPARAPLEPPPLRPRYDVIGTVRRGG